MRTRGLLRAAMVGAGLMLTSQAMALPTFPGGPWTFDLEDRSSLYSEPNGIVQAAPAGSLQGVGAPGALGLYNVGTPNLTGPVYQRSIYRLKEVDTGTIITGEYSMTAIKTQSFVDNWESGGHEGTGVATNLVLTSTAGLAASTGSGGTALGSRLYFSPDPRQPAYVDTVPGLATNFGKGGLDGAGQATKAAGFGGLIKLYSDGSADASFGTAPGDAGWSDVGLAWNADPSYPKFGESGDGSTLVAIGVFSPLYAAGLENPTDPVLLEALYNANFGPGAFDAKRDLNAVMIEDFDNLQAGKGIGFVNIIWGTSGFLNTFTPDFFGAGRDLRLDFQLAVATEGGNPINIIDPPAGDPAGTSTGWNVASTDPAQGFRLAIPEPMTAGLGMLGMVVLAGYTSRRRPA